MGRYNEPAYQVDTERKEQMLGTFKQNHHWLPDPFFFSKRRTSVSQPRPLHLYLGLRYGCSAAALFTLWATVNAFAHLRTGLLSNMVFGLTMLCVFMIWVVGAATGWNKFITPSNWR